MTFVKRIINTITNNLWLCVGFFPYPLHFFMNHLVMDIEGPLYQYQTCNRIYLCILLHYASCKYLKETFKDKLGSGRCGKDKYDNDYYYDIME